MLSAELNRIHKGSRTSGTVSDVASGLSSDDLWQVAAMHLAALLRLEPTLTGFFHTGRIQFGPFGVHLQYAGFREADIEYSDRNIGFYAEGVEISNRDGPTMLSNMLCLLHYARYHSDTLVYLPPEMRACRLRTIASDCGASDPFTSFICARFPWLQRTVIG
jgi:hypothetical protein